MQSEEFGEGTCILGVFSNEENAKKYANIQSQLSPYYIFWVNPQKLLDASVNLNIEVKNYFLAYIDIENGFNESDLNEEDAWTESEPMEYTFDNYVVVKKDTIESYSIESCDKAREILKDFLEHSFKGEPIKLQYKIIDKSSDQKYLDYNTKICPICGGKIKHPYTGELTQEQIEEDEKTCQLVEVIDENNFTLGFHAICRNR
jgi:hypothetical protein